jgi:septal ring factor EnvC (AmiA/AmiB activator)
MGKVFSAVAVAAVFAAPAALAQNTVYKCTDSEGRSQYTNIRDDAKGKSCVVVSESKVTTVPAQKFAPAGFPKVDPNTQKTRDDGRRKILEDELAAEQRNLNDAKLQLAAQEAIRNGDEKNYQRVLDRLKPFQETVERHEKNIAALQRELTNLK